MIAVLISLEVKFTGVYAQTNTAGLKSEFSYDKESAKQNADINMKVCVVKDKKFYLVENEKQLRSIGSGRYTMNDNYMLNNDIALTKEWKAIGNEESPFTGSFNGNGFCIDNLKITDKKAKYAGLFGYAEGAAIYNVTLKNVDIRVGKGKNKHVGAVVALMLDGKVYDCKVENAD